MLQFCSGVASAAAATALNVGKDIHDVLGLLELGRGVVTSLLLEMRADISDLRREHPELARQFEDLRDELDLSIDQPTYSISADATPLLVTDVNQRYEADQKFCDLVGRIHAQPGFETFCSHQLYMK
jgi:hypothetical protein